MVDIGPEFGCAKDDHHAQRKLAWIKVELLRLRRNIVQWNLNQARYLLEIFLNFYLDFDYLFGFSWGTRKVGLITFLEIFIFIFWYA